MGLWTVKINDFSMSHLEECPIWGTYEIVNDKKHFNEQNWMEPEELNLALNHKKAVEVADGPFSIAADFQLSGGIQCKGYVVVSEIDLDIYALFIWTGTGFCPFNKFFDKMSKISILLDRLNDQMKTNLEPEEVFPIQYQFKLTKSYIEDLELGKDDTDEYDIGELQFGSTGIFNLPG